MVEWHGKLSRIKIAGQILLKVVRSVQIFCINAMCSCVVRDYNAFNLLSHSFLNNLFSSICSMKIWQSGVC